MENKDTLSQITYWVLYYESTKGHLKWGVADVARSAKISRSLIYYHCGNSKFEIITNCLNHITTEYFGMTEERISMFKNGQIAECLMLTRELLMANPVMSVLYQRVRVTPSPLQNLFVAIEGRYQQKIKAYYPHLSDNEVVMFHSFFHGILTAPFMNDGAFKESSLFLENYILQKSASSTSSVK